MRYGHRAAFVTLTLFAALLLAATLAKLAETNRHRDAAATGLRTLAANYRWVLRSPEFRAYTLVGERLVRRSFRVHFGLVVRADGRARRALRNTSATPTPSAYAATSRARSSAAICSARTTVERALRTGAVLALASGLAMAVLAVAGIHHWAAVVGPAFGFFLSHGINFPCGQIGSVAPFPRQAGAAAGLYGFCMMMVAALTGVLIGASYNGTVYPLAFTMAGFGAALFAIVFVVVARLGAKAARRKARFPEGEDTAL